MILIIKDDNAQLRERAELERRLRRWGRVFGPSPATEWDEGEGANSLLGELLRRARVGAVNRCVDDSLWNPQREDLCRGDGSLIRSIPGSDRVTARGKESRGGAHRSYVDPDAQLVDITAVALWRVHMVRGVVLRAEYCLRGPRREKAVYAAQVACLARLPVRRYSQHLDAAIDWMTAHLPAERRKAA